MSTIDEVSELVGTWREQKKSNNEKMPGELREKIRGLVGAVSEVELRARLQLPGQFFREKKKKRKTKKRTPQFVQLTGRPQVLPAVSTIKIELACGARLEVVSGDPFLRILMDRLLGGAK